jgi:hypothetical protein
MVLNNSDRFSIPTSRWQWAAKPNGLPYYVRSPNENGVETNARRVRIFCLMYGIRSAEIPRRASVHVQSSRRALEWNTWRRIRFSTMWVKIQLAVGTGLVSELPVGWFTNEIYLVLRRRLRSELESPGNIIHPDAAANKISNRWVFFRLIKKGWNLAMRNEDVR